MNVLSLSAVAENTFNDADGDEVVQLDYNSRNRKIQSLNVKPNHIYDSEEEIKKTLAQNEIAKREIAQETKKEKIIVEKIYTTRSSKEKIMSVLKQFDAKLNSFESIMKLNPHLVSYKNKKLPKNTKIKYLVKDSGSDNDNSKAKP